MHPMVVIGVGSDPMILRFAHPRCGSVSACFLNGASTYPQLAGVMLLKAATKARNFLLAKHKVILGTKGISENIITIFRLVIYIGEKHTQ